MPTIQFVNHKGEPLDPFDPARQAETPKRQRYTDRRIAEGFHMGWKVVGYPPGTLEKAKKHHEAERKRIAKANLSALKPEMVPGPWSETVWKEMHKPRGVRGRPYELESAAAHCMRLAEAAGWIDVRIVEVKKPGAGKPAK